MHKHDYDVQRYRENTTDKCPGEIALISLRKQAGIDIGSPEYMGIDRTCFAANCRAKYHWCPTCVIAPRCDCLAPHYSPVDVLMETSYVSPPRIAKTMWKIDQSANIARLEKIPCDNRYGTFVLTVKRVAIDKKSTTPFCLKCTIRLQSSANMIGEIYGRTYLEQAHFLWQAIKLFICDECTSVIDDMPCMHMNDDCPSRFVKLISPRLLAYQSRKFEYMREPIQAKTIKETVRTKQCPIGPKRAEYCINIERSPLWMDFWHNDSPLGQIPGLEDEVAA